MSEREPLAIDLRGLRFAYPGGAAVLDGLSWRLPVGAFAVVTGAVGSGKSTLLRLLKPGLAPTGELAGERLVVGRELGGWSRAESAASIGHVAQDPEAHVVCDTVEREIAFALENLGMPAGEMRRRVAGVAHFLGIAPLVRRRCAELSAGELQAVAVASALAPLPGLLLLDEPTSRLDPVATHNLLHLLFRANRELGVTVVVATHAPEVAAAYVTCAFELADGRLWERDLPFSIAGPSVFPYRPGRDGAPGARENREAVCGVEDEGDASCRKDPLKGGDTANPSDSERQKPSSRGSATRAFPKKAPFTGTSMQPKGASPLVRVDDVHFRYGRTEPEALRGVDLTLDEGEVVALVGANGSGKTTLAKVVAGMARPQRGRVRNRAAARQAYLPQDPKALFACDRVGDELAEWRRSAGYTDAEITAVAGRLGLSGLLDAHPYDLSGGQQQLLALAKLVLTDPALLVCDEPTQGVDPGTRVAIARELLELAARGATVLFATHDLAFASRVADRVALVFDGELACVQPAEEFFAHELFYQVRPDGFTRLFDAGEEGRDG